MIVRKWLGIFLQHYTRKGIKVYAKYRKRMQCGKYDLTGTMNADGSAMLKCSSYSIWPVQLTINELPLLLRTSTVILPLWYGTKHPNMTLLLQASAKQMRTLAVKGVHWKADRKTIYSKVNFDALL